MAYKVQKLTWCLLALSFSASVRSQSTATVEYPFMTLTLYIDPELATATIPAHTQRDTVPGFVTTDTLMAATLTEMDGGITRTVPGAVLTRSNPDITIIQSIPVQTATRELWYLTATETIQKKSATYTLTSGQTLDYYTVTGPTFGNSYIYTIIESFNQRQVIRTIPGPTLTYTVADQDPETFTENGVLSTHYDNPVTIVETMGETRITRNIAPDTSTIIRTGTLSYTPTSSVSISVSTATVMMTRDGTTVTVSPTFISAPTKCIPKPKKCTTKPNECPPETNNA
ncbi:hypothetical protein K7432_004549 [Basidiobolus ranarum]|uniref:Uncharacterized protein n=1 Tax=Basidiobolus ranarum TaxID=34480 RepID=A0ABR2W4Q0_9FUNG